MATAQHPLHLKKKTIQKRKQTFRSVKSSVTKRSQPTNGQCAKRTPNSKKCRKKHRTGQVLSELALAVCLGGVLTWLCSIFFVAVVTVPGYGMMPILRAKDQVLVRKTIEVKRFDLVVFSVGANKKQVRRVIGLPGETISYKDDTLYVNDQQIDEKFLVAEINESQKNGKNYTEDFPDTALEIPTNYYFVLGDNRPYATDSRHYGLIAKKKIFGKIMMQLFPFNEIKAF